MSVLVTTPPGAALFKLVCIKPADDPSFAPYENFGELVFWYDPDFYGHSSGIKPVYSQPSPVCVGKVISSLVQGAETPASEVKGRTRINRLHLIDGAEDVHSFHEESADGCDAGANEDRAKARRFEGEAGDARLLHNHLSVIGRISKTPGVLEYTTPVARQHDGAGREHHRCDVKQG